MRISDWSSDVCSSDLLVTPRELPRAQLIEERHGQPLRWEQVAPLSGKPRTVPQAAMATLRIDAGRTDKLRPGDIVGALTGEAGLHQDAIGKIDVYATRSSVAIARTQAEQALARLRAGKNKGRKFKIGRESRWERVGKYVKLSAVA